MIDAPVFREKVTDPDAVASARAYDQRLKRNLDWLNTHWDDLLPEAHGRYVAVAGQEAFVADSYGQAWAMATAAHPDDDAAWGQYVPTKSENFLTFDIETDPDRLAQSQAQAKQFKRNSDWLEAHWPDLLPQARGKYLVVAGQEAFLADAPEDAWAAARAAHPEDDGALSQYVTTKLGPRIYAHRRRVETR